MYQYVYSRSILGLVLFSLLSTGVYGAKVGYYEMYEGEGLSWAIAPITASGHTPVYLSDLSAADLQGLDVLFVTNYNNVDYAAEYLSRLPEIDAAVMNGLVLIIHDRRVSHAASILPGGSNINFARTLNSYVDIKDNSTQVTNGPGGVLDDNSLDGALYSDHGHAVEGSLPSGGATILTQLNKSEAVTFSYPYGQGSVIYSSIPVDRYIRLSPICYRFVSTNPTRRVCLNVVNTYTPNVVAYAAELKNSKPLAKAGIDQSIDEGMPVSLDAAASRGHGALSYKWTQLSPASPLVALIDSASATPSFKAPMVNMNTTFTMQLVVTDARGNVSDPDTVDITVKNLNTPPVADAGNDFAIKAGASALLDGSQSYDADGDLLVSYSWSQVAGPAVSIQNPDSAKATFMVPNVIGQDIVFELSVSDGMEMSLASRVTVGIVDNAAPLTDAGVDQTRDEGNIVMMSALGSSDPDNDGLLFSWLQIEGPAVTLDNPGSPTPYFTAPRVAGGGMVVKFELTVTDTDGLNPKSSADQVAIHVRNINDPPACGLARPSVASLWPPNHKMRSVAIEGVSDKDSIYKDVAIVINSVTMDEPVAGHGSGHSSPDAVIQDMSPADVALLRAERKKHSNGRVYQVNFTASDGFESCTGHIQVTVPKSRKRDKCGDERHGKSHDRKHDDKGHKPKRKHATQCQAPIVVDDGQLYNATEVRQQHDHDGKDKAEKKLADLKAKREGHKNKKNHKKKNRQEDD